jgi:hypothetical protein
MSGGTWAITTARGCTATGYLPPWAKEDPSETGVPHDRLSLRLADVSHYANFPGQLLPVSSPGCIPCAVPAGHQEEVLRGSLDCNPYDDDPGLRIPVANIEVVADHWLTGLGPDDLAGLAAKLRTQADRLDHEIRPALVAAREDWADHHAPTR